MSEHDDHGSAPLPPLTERIDPGAAGGREFSRLMHQLLLVHAERHRFLYELHTPADDATGDGVDGIACDGIPGLEGTVAFRFKWLWGDLYRGGNAAHIRASLARASDAEMGLQHWVLVTPWDLKPSEREWLRALKEEGELSVHHWGQTKIEQLLRQCPPLFARYYPRAARPLLPGYEGADFGELARSYRTRVAAAHDHLKTIGLPSETAREREPRAGPRLRDLFIPLRLIPEGASAAPKDLARVLARGGSAVVLGDPGTGKSTLLAYLALLFSGGASLDGFSPPPNRIPLLVSLRELMRLQRDRQELSLLDYLAVHARQSLSLPQAHRAFFEAALRMGEAVVLLDGLDEVGNEAARIRVSTLIQTFHDQFPACPFWVTSRSYGYTSDDCFSSAAFAHYRIGPLDKAQVNGFIDRWYALQIPDSAADRAARAASLRDALDRTPSARSLANNPLLLTLVACTPHGLRKLPQDRGALYEHCVEMLLKTWPEARRGDPTAPHALGDLKLPVETQKDYLAHLALFVQEQKHAGNDEEKRGIFSRRVNARWRRAVRDWVRVPRLRTREEDEEMARSLEYIIEEEERGLFSRAEAIDCLAARHFQRAARDRPSLTRPKAREEMARFLEYIVDETGLVMDRGDDELSFIHLSLQEYLAAWAFTCGGDTPSGPALFEQHLGEPAWEEVLLLRLHIALRAPGGGGEDEVDRIVSRLVRSLEEKRSTLGWLTLVRALRDDLEFTDVNRKLILTRALGFWLDAPDLDGTWFLALEEVRLRAERARGALREVLAEARAREPSARALAALHLETRLFGFPADAAEALREHPDLPAMLPDLVAFLDEPGIDALLAERATFADWDKALRALDRPVIYRRTLAWAATPPAKAAAEAALGLFWGKILDDLGSRSAFAAPGRHHHKPVLFKQPWSVTTETKSASARLPLAGTRALPVDIPRREARLETPARWDKLTRERLDRAGERDPWTELNAWTAALISAQIEGFPSTEGIDPAAVHRTAEIFGRDFIRSFVSSFVSTAGRSFVCDFGRSFVRDFGYTFLGDFSRSFVRDFVRDFLRSCDFLRPFVRDLGRPFVRTFSRKFGRKFGREFGIDPSKPGWEAAWDRAMEEEDNQVRLLQNGFFWWSDPPYHSSLQIDPEQELPDLVATLENPLALPFLLVDVWCAAALQHVLTMCRAMAVLHPYDEVQGESIDAWLQRNPIDVYGVAFAWEEHAKRFAAAHRSLAGVEGALFLAHAAYASLMTGLECKAPVWQDLLEKRDLADPHMCVSYTLYELCNFRDAQANMRMLEDDILLCPPKEILPVLEVAGLAPGT